MREKVRMSNKIETYCDICKTFISNRYRSTIRKNQKFYCSKECKSIDYKNRFLGDKNPNFGNKWSIEQRNNLSEKMIKRFECPQARFIAGNSNRGKKFSGETRKKMSDERRGRSSWRVMSEETKKIAKEKISIASSKKFTPEFLRKQRIKNEKLGIWIPLNQKTDYQIYFKEAEWNVSHIETFLNHKKYSELGIFHNTKNSKGLVRDHWYSRKQGFEEKVFPIILTHPANVNIITIGENVSKRFGKNDILITKEFLFEMIINYQDEWFQQKECLEKIEAYNQGQRWSRKGAS